MHDLAVVAVVAVAALPVQEPDDPLQLPVRLALIVAGSLRVTAALPLTLTASPVLSPVLSAIVISRAVPQLAVVTLAVPLNEVPLMVRAVCNFVAVAALPVHEPEEPEQFPVTFPLSAPLNVLAVTSLPVVMVTLLMESVPEADSIILDV